METIAAVATPRGAGALSVVRCSGGRARETVLEMLRAPRPELPARRAVRVVLSDEAGDIDEAVAVFFPADQSPTGEDLVELTVHGSPYIVSRTLSRALELGARPARPGEFTQRSFLNGRLDLAQAEAVCALIRARSEAAHRAAWRQLEGGLSARVRECRAPLFDLLVRVEACLDHPEEDIPSLRPEEALAALSAAAGPVERLAATFERGRLSADGARVALVGRPNAGKSSILNALLGRDRAIVCAEPGTTRDTLEEPAELEGYPSVLIDTAGLREAYDASERAGVKRAEAALDSCDLALLIVDGSREASEEDGRVHAKILESAARRGRPVIAVLNKSDLGLAQGHGLAEAVAVSARQGTGLLELQRQVSRRLAASQEEESAVVASSRHHDALRAALRELRGAADAVGAFPGRWEDRAASHLREAVRELGLILGEGAGDQALHAVFSRFCVGK